MKIKVNGEEKVIHNPSNECTLTDALNELGYKSNSIIVELNNLIINHEYWQEKMVTS